MGVKTTNTVYVSRMTGKCLIKKKAASGEGKVELDGMQTQERILAMRTDQTESRSMVGGCYWNQWFSYFIPFRVVPISVGFVSLRISVVTPARYLSNLATLPLPGQHSAESGHFLFRLLQPHLNDVSGSPVLSWQPLPRHSLPRSHSDLLTINMIT